MWGDWESSSRFSVLSSQFLFFRGVGCSDFAYLGWGVLPASFLRRLICGMLIGLGEERRGLRWPRFLFGASSYEERKHEERKHEERKHEEQAYEKRAGDNCTKQE